MANNDNYEVETQGSSGGISRYSAASRIHSSGIGCAQRVFERNVRYENDDKSLTDNGIVVRLRQDHRVRLTYKEPTPADT